MSAQTGSMPRAQKWRCKYDMQEQNTVQPKDQALWNAIFSVAFLVLFALFYWINTDGLDMLQWIAAIGVFDITIMALATFRIVRLVSYDKIFAFVRNFFLDPIAPASPVGEEHACENCRSGAAPGYKKPPGGPRRTVAELLECMWCTGLWAALGVAFLYFLAPPARLLVIILAIAAVGSFLQNVSQMIGRIGQK